MVALKYALVIHHLTGHQQVTLRAKIVHDERGPPARCERLCTCGAFGPRHAMAQDFVQDDDNYNVHQPKSSFVRVVQV